MLNISFDDAYRLNDIRFRIHEFIWGNLIHPSRTFQSQEAAANNLWILLSWCTASKPVSQPRPVSWSPAFIYLYFLYIHTLYVLRKPHSCVSCILNQLTYLHFLFRTSNHLLENEKCSGKSTGPFQLSNDDGMELRFLAKMLET